MRKGIILFTVVACFFMEGLSYAWIPDTGQTKCYNNINTVVITCPQPGEDFYGQDGEFKYDQLNAMLLYQLRRHKRVNAQILPITVQPAGLDEAEARFQLLLTGGEGWIPDSGQLFEVISLWQLQDGEWRLRSAQWQPVGPGAR